MSNLEKLKKLMGAVPAQDVEKVASELPTQSLATDAIPAVPGTGQVADQSMSSRALRMLSAPQRFVMNKAANALGVPGNPENSEESAQGIVGNLAERAGIPEDSTLGNVAKAAVVGGLEVFGDPLGALPVGKMAKAAKVTEAFPALKKIFSVGGKTFEAASTADALKIKAALENAGHIKPNGVLQVLDK